MLLLLTLTVAAAAPHASGLELGLVGGRTAMSWAEHFAVEEANGCAIESRADGVFGARAAWHLGRFVAVEAVASAFPEIESRRITCMMNEFPAGAVPGSRSHQLVGGVWLAPLQLVAHGREEPTGALGVRVGAGAVHTVDATASPSKYVQEYRPLLQVAPALALRVGRHLGLRAEVPIDTWVERLGLDERVRVTRTSALVGVSWHPS